MKIESNDFITLNSHTEVIIGNVTESNIVIVLIYRHPTGDIESFLETMENVLSSKHLNKNINTIICGYFNIDILTSNYRCEGY